MVEPRIKRHFSPPLSPPNPFLLHSRPTILTGPPHLRPATLGRINEEQIAWAGSRYETIKNDGPCRLADMYLPFIEGPRIYRVGEAINDSRCPGGRVLRPPDSLVCRKKRKELSSRMRSVCPSARPRSHGDVGLANRTKQGTGGARGFQGKYTYTCGPTCLRVHVGV